MPEIKKIFVDSKLVLRIKDKLPKLFHMAELESARAGKIGMEVGSLSEKVIVALLIYKFGSSVDTKLPITEPEAGVKLDGRKISVETITADGGVVRPSFREQSVTHSESLCYKQRVIYQLFERRDEFHH